MPMNMGQKLSAYTTITKYYRNLAHGMNYSSLWSLIEYLITCLLLLLSDEALAQEVHRALEQEKE